MISERDFNALTQEDQVSRLQAMARAALDEFGVRAERIEPLVHAENTTYHIFSPQGEFNLRISRPGYQSASNIQSEIDFLIALKQENFNVPVPYQSRLVRVEVPEVPEARVSVLLGWQSGEFRKERLSSEEAHLVGATMARLHDFTNRWTPPSNFDRQPMHDWIDEPRDVPFDRPIDGVSEEDRQMLLQIDAESREMLRRLDRSPDNYGLIHADLHVGNLLFEDDYLNIIDFDDLGYAFYVHDFSSALAFQVGKPNYLEVRDSMFAGYESVRPLPPGTRDLLKPFLRKRLMGVSSWIMRRTDNPNFRETGVQWVRTFAENIRLLD